MKFVASLLVLTIIVFNYGSTLTTREKRQTSNSNYNKPCDPRPLPTECPNYLTVNSTSSTTTPDCTSGNSSGESATCSDAKKICCDAVVLTTPASLNSTTKKICVDPVPLGLKPGKCPARSKVFPVWNECKWDTNCPENQKCCGGGDKCTYFTCVAPILK